VTFWDHLEELRRVLFKVVGAVMVLMVVAFCFKDELFAVVLAPQQSDFIVYRWLGAESFQVQLINTQLASQFITHMKVACYAGILLASPYIIYQLFRFVSPALYANERRYVVQMTFWGYLLFMLGVLLNYFLIFPLTFRFLGTYQASALVENTITLTSYVDTLMMLSLMMGIVFEIPILSWLFAKLGFLTSSFMKKYRRHAIVLILIVAAFITPTSDVFTLTLVSLPMYLLYEISISVVKRTEPNQKGGVA
jgi:sec-independent protein translocase protein TatC